MSFIVKRTFGAIGDETITSSVKWKGTSEVHLARLPAIKQAYAPQARTVEILLYFMVLDVKKEIKLSNLLTGLRVDVLPDEIKFNYKVHQDARDLIIMRVRERFWQTQWSLMYHLPSYTESSSVTARSSPAPNNPPPDLVTHTYTPNHTCMHAHCSVKMWREGWKWQ